MRRQCSNEERGTTKAHSPTDPGEVEVGLPDFGLAPVGETPESGTTGKDRHPRIPRNENLVRFVVDEVFQDPQTEAEVARDQVQRLQRQARDTDADGPAAPPRRSARPAIRLPTHHRLPFPHLADRPGDPASENQCPPTGPPVAEPSQLSFLFFQYLVPPMSAEAMRPASVS
jgi:hypothetical protein